VVIISKNSYETIVVVIISKNSYETERRKSLLTGLKDGCS